MQLPTQRVIGNLFYRRLMLRRLPAIGDTLRTTTEIVALKRNAVKEGRKPTGLAVLHIVTSDQADRAILDYWRCAMLPINDLDASEPHGDDRRACRRAKKSIEVDVRSEDGREQLS